MRHIQFVVVAALSTFCEYLNIGTGNLEHIYSVELKFTGLIELECTRFNMVISAQTSGFESNECIWVQTRKNVSNYSVLKCARTNSSFPLGMSWMW